MLKEMEIKSSIKTSEQVQEIFLRRIKVRVSWDLKGLQVGKCFVDDLVGGTSFCSATQCLGPAFVGLLLDCSMSCPPL